MEYIKGGRAKGRSYKEFDPKQVAMGIEVELEHTDDIRIAEEIAKDHLAEDPEYYTKLKTIHQENPVKEYKKIPSGVKFLGSTDAINTCDACGKKNLKKTFALEDSEGNFLGYFGSDCVRRQLGWEQSKFNKRYQAELDKAISRELFNLNNSEVSKKITDWRYKYDRNKQDETKNELIEEYRTEFKKSLANLQKNWSITEEDLLRVVGYHIPNIGVPIIDKSLKKDNPTEKPIILGWTLKSNLITIKYPNGIYEFEMPPLVIALVTEQPPQWESKVLSYIAKYKIKGTKR